MRVGRALRKWLVKENLSTGEAMAEKLGVSRPQLYRIFADRAEISVQRLLSAGVDLGWLQKEVAAQQ